MPVNATFSHPPTPLRYWKKSVVRLHVHDRGFAAAHLKVPQPRAVNRPQPAAFITYERRYEVLVRRGTPAAVDACTQSPGVVVVLHVHVYMRAASPQVLCCCPLRMPHHVLGQRRQPPRSGCSALGPQLSISAVLSLSGGRPRSPTCSCCMYVVRRVWPACPLSRVGPLPVWTARRVPRLAQTCASTSYDLE